jgi:hypothetical protein
MQSRRPLASKEIGILKMNEEKNKAAIVFFVLFSFFFLFLFLAREDLTMWWGMFSLIHQKTSISNVRFCI